MKEGRNAFKILTRKLTVNIYLERLRYRLEESIRMDLKGRL